VRVPQALQIHSIPGHSRHGIEADRAPVRLRFPCGAQYLTLHARIFPLWNTRRKETVSYLEEVIRRLLESRWSDDVGIAQAGSSKTTSDERAQSLPPSKDPVIPPSPCPPSPARKWVTPDIESKRVEPLYVSAFLIVPNI
jgi:hypothetical protein